MCRTSASSARCRGHVTCPCQMLQDVKLTCLAHVQVMACQPLALWQALQSPYAHVAANLACMGQRGRQADTHSRVLHLPWLASRPQPVNCPAPKWPWLRDADPCHDCRGIYVRIPKAFELVKRPCCSPYCCVHICYAA